jgi:hypothetical protein
MMHRRLRKNKKHNTAGKSWTRRIIRVFALAAALSAVACDTPEEIVSIELPITPALVMQTSWAVITSSHLRLRDGPSIDSTAVATLWRGSVLEIVSKTGSKEIVEDEEDLWYQINYDGLAGWVFGAYLSTFESKAQADESARELRR